MTALNKHQLRITIWSWSLGFLGLVLLTSPCVYQQHAASQAGDHRSEAGQGRHLPRVVHGKADPPDLG